MVRLPIYFIKVVMYLSIVFFFIKESDNDKRFFEKQICKKLFYFEVIFPIQYWRNLNFNFLYA